jgi:hypothetical protein
MLQAQAQAAGLLVWRGQQAQQGVTPAMCKSHGAAEIGVVPVQVQKEDLKGSSGGGAAAGRARH